MQEYERALKYIFPACSKVAGKTVTQTLAVLDLKGVGLRHLSADVRRIISTIFRVDQDNYPETLGKTLVINAPSIFKVIFAMFKPVLDARTQAKVEVRDTLGSRSTLPGAALGASAEQQAQIILHCSSPPVVPSCGPTGVRL